MRIMFFISSLQSGGAERVMCELANELVSRDHEVCIEMIVNDKCYYSLSDKVERESLDCEKDLVFPRFKRMRMRQEKIRKAEGKCFLIS